MIPISHPELSLTEGLIYANDILQHFWRRWKAEYLLELREFHRAREERGSMYIIQVGDIVTVYDESHPRGLWRLGKVESLIRDCILPRIPSRAILAALRCF